ncbi:MAG: dephospho-CoA kinase [Desulfuromonas sp.]|nr:dephospho-CoA kinase [Desulfuromonas sp.]
MILGVTGGIASGKSTVAKMLGEMGALVISADELARELVLPGSAVLLQVQKRFGAQMLKSDGTLDRKRLGDYVFSRPEARRELEEIMHPAIAELSKKRLLQASRTQEKTGGLVVYEAPLLFEAGARDRVDRVLTVTVAEDVQLRRLQKRDSCSIADAKKRVAAHIPQSEKVRLADYVIDNSADRDALQHRVAALYATLVNSGAGN